MLKVTEISGAGKAANSGGDMLAYLKATEYYKDSKGEQTIPSAYYGKGAEALGLVGAVDFDVMDALAQGFDKDGNALVQNAGSPNRIMGYDATFSAPKGVSVLFAKATPEMRDLILKAHKDAVAEAFGYLESLATTRMDIDGVITEVPVKGLIGMGMSHLTSRNLEAQLHDHVLIPQVCICEDGKTRTFLTEVLMKHQRDGDAVYQASLARRVQELGFGVEKVVNTDEDGKIINVTFDVAGISQNEMEAMSSRRAEIEAYMEKYEVSAQQACLATRRHKDEPSYPELVDMWDKVFSTMDPSVVSAFDSLHGRANVTDIMPDELIMKELHKNESLWKKSDLVKLIGEHYIGVLGTAQEIEAEAVDFMKRNHVVEYIQGRNRFFASHEMVVAERDMVERSVIGMDNQACRISPEVMNQGIAVFERQKNATLKPEQRAAVEHICLNTGRVAVLEGFAGTGKTFSALAYIEAYKAAGFECIGAAVSWKAATKLQSETGMKSYSCAALLQLLESGKLTLKPNQHLVLDEASMVDSMTYAKLLKFVEDAGTANKIIMMGDNAQLTAVGAGSPMRLVVDRIGSIKMSDITRQQKLEDKITASMYYGLDHNLIRDIGEAQLRIQALNRTITLHQQKDTFSLEEVKALFASDFEKNKELGEQRVSEFFRYSALTFDRATKLYQAKDYSPTAKEESLAQIHDQIDQLKAKVIVLDAERQAAADQKRTLTMEISSPSHKANVVLGQMKGFDTSLLAKKERLESMTKELNSMEKNTLAEQDRFYELKSLIPRITRQVESMSASYESAAKHYCALLNTKGNALENFTKALDTFQETSLKVETANTLKGLHTLMDAFSREDIEQRFTAIDPNERARLADTLIRVHALTQREDGLYVAPWYNAEEKNASLDAFEQSIRPLRTQVIESMGTGGSAIVNRLREQNQVVEATTRKEAIAKLVMDYFDSQESLSEKLVITGSNADKDKLNDAIRSEMKNRGTLDEAQEVQVETIDRGFKKTVGFCPGDLIKFTAKDESKTLGIINGDEGKVLSVVQRSDGTADFRVLLASDVPEKNNTVVTFNTKEHCRITHNYAISIHASQGQGKNQVFKLVSESAKMENSNLDLVSFTRCKRDYTVYGAEFDIGKLAEKIEKEQVKVTTLDMSKECEQIHHEHDETPTHSIMDSLQKAAIHVELVKNEALEAARERLIKLRAALPLQTITMKPAVVEPVQERSEAIRLR